MQDKSENLVTASELAEFVYCRRAWALSKQGLGVHEKTEAQRAGGIRFHEARAAELQPATPAFRRWAMLLAVISALLLALALASR